MNWYKRQLKIAMPTGVPLSQDIIDRIIYLRKNMDLTINDISKEVGVSRFSVNKVLKQYGTSKSRLTKDQIDEIAYFYENGVSVRELSEAYNITLNQVGNILKKKNIFDISRKYEEYKVDVRDENKGDILRKYREGYGVKELSREYGESIRAITSFFENNNIHIRSREEQYAMEHFRQNASEKQKQFNRNNPEAVHEHSRKMLEWWKQFGEESGEKFKNRLLAYPTRQQAMNHLMGFVGSQNEDPKNANAIYTKYINIINNHTFPDEIQQPVSV